ncbi:MAG: hypothetical protein Q9208_000050 [Pyrenodesmia sp. 3 TL-2023]
MADIEEARQKSKGKGRESESVPDAELAFQLQQEELEREAIERADQRMAASIGRAVQDDGANITIMAGEESRAAADRQMACRLGGQIAQPHPQMRVLDVDDDILSKLDAFSIDDTGDYNSSAPSPSGSEAGESSAWAAGRRARPSSHVKRQCAVAAINSVICVEQDGSLVDAYISKKIGYCNGPSKLLIGLHQGVHRLAPRLTGRKESTRSRGTSVTATTVSIGAGGKRLRGGPSARNVATG